MSNLKSSPRLSFGNNLFMSYDPTSLVDDTSQPLDAAMNNKIPEQIFEIIVADNMGNIAIKTSSGHYLTFNKEVTKSTDKINFGKEGDPNLILIEHLGKNKIAFKTKTLGYVMANNGGDLRPKSPNWCFSTEATEIGEQQKFQIAADRKQFTYGFVIDPAKAIKNEKDEIIISFADLPLSGKPLVFLTPATPLQNRFPIKIPTVVRVGKTHITIQDHNIKPQGYRLNVLLVDPKFNQGSMLYPAQISKSENRIAVEASVKPANACFLTPFWDGGGSVTSVETINTQLIAGLQTTFSNSTNAIINNPFPYFVNYLSLRSSQTEFFVCGTDIGFRQYNGIPIHERTMGPNPCVILTPQMEGDAIAKSLPYVNAYTDYGFFVMNDKLDPRLTLNWMAVRQDVPRIDTDNQLSNAFEHIFTHLPEHKEHINTFRGELEKIILMGAEPSADLLNKSLDFIPSYSKNRTKSVPSEIHMAMAKVCFDAIAILINATVALRVYVNEKAIKAIAQEIAIAAEVGETEPLIKDALEEFPKFAKLFDDSNQNVYELDFAKLKNIALGLKVLAGSMFTLGLVKSVLVAVYHQFKMSAYTWIITCLTIVSQGLAIVLSGGAAALAWVFRIAGLLGSATTLGLDAYGLYLLENKKP